MKSRTIGILLATVAILALLWAAGSAVASPPSAEPGGDVTITGTVASRISYQGVLKENGSPVTGSRNMTFRLYSNSACSTQVGSNIVKSGVQVTNGLFTVDLDVDDDDFNGQGLWLEVEVAGTEIGCEEILPVPYALSLRPGALILDEDITRPTFSVQNGWPGGYWAVTKKAISGWTSDGTALWGAAGSGIGVYGHSVSGTALYAGGTGVIKSTAKSYTWISGNNLQKSDSDDTTEFKYDLYGGYKVYGGSDWETNKTVLLPVTIPGQLYGQDVTVTGLDLYYKNSDDLTGIAITAMRRQNGVGTGDLIFRDETPLVCPSVRCTQHWDLSQNNVLSDQQGILYIAMSLDFISATSYVQIGGARLTLEHD